jgi:hypothetical protein
MVLSRYLGTTASLTRDGMNRAVYSWMQCREAVPMFSQARVVSRRCKTGAQHLESYLRSYSAPSSKCNDALLQLWLLPCDRAYVPCTHLHSCMDYDISVRAFLTEIYTRLRPRHESSIASIMLRDFPRFYNRAVVGSCLGSGGYVSRPRVR